MIGSDQSLSPGSVQIKKRPLANALGIKPPQYLSDDTVQDAQNNAIAQGYRTGRVQARRGFSNSKYTATQQGLQDAASLGQAAQKAAGIGAEAQAFNAAQRDQHNQMKDAALASRRGHDLALHDALLAQRNQTQQLDQQYRLGEEVQRDRLKYSLLGRMV